MKLLLLFFVAFYVCTRTCRGFNLTHINVIFVNNVIDPDAREVEEVKNLMALPMMAIRNPTWSLITDYGLLQNYSIIFSKEPDVVETIPSLELEKPAMMNHFENLIDNCTSNSGNATLKSLLKALEMSSDRTVIFLVANRRTNDTEMLKEIMKTMLIKLTPVFVIPVYKNTSMFQPILLNMTRNFAKLPLTVLTQDFEQLGPEYFNITQASKYICYQIGMAGLYEKLRLYMTARPILELNSLSIVYDIIEPTEEEIVNISESMKSDAVSYFQLISRLANQPYSVIFSSKQDTVVTKIPAVEYYTAKDFHDMIKSQMNKTAEKTSLKTLLKTLQTIPVSSLVKYYVNKHPGDQYEVLSEIVQLIMDKKIQVDIKPIGYYATPGLRLPVAYRTIAEISRKSRVRGSGYRTCTNWITFLVIVAGFVITKII